MWSYYSIHNAFYPSEYPDYLSPITHAMGEFPLTLVGNYNDIYGRIVLSGQDPDHHFTYQNREACGILISNALDCLERG